MSFGSKYGKSSVHFTFDATGLPYKSLADLYRDNGEKHVYPIRAIYINTKGRYGDQALLACDEYIVNLPQHLLSTCNQMREDPEAVDLINQGKAGFTIYPYDGKSGRKGFSVNWVDCDSPKLPF